MSSLATSGDGTAASPWSGWEGLTIADYTEYHFEKGWFAYSTSPNWLKVGVSVTGEAGSVLKHTGSGDAFIMDAGAVPGSLWLHIGKVENLFIRGNANTRHGMFLRGVRQGAFSNIEIRDIPEAGVWSEACVTNVFTGLTVNHRPASGWTIRPKYGMVTTGRGADWSTTWTITNSILEGIELGLWFKADSYGNTVINGTSEGNDKGDLVEGSYNTFINRDNEANWASGIDWEITGSYNQLQNVFSQTLIKIHGSHNIVTGGHIQNLTIAPSDGGAAYYNILQGPKVLGAFADTGNHTIYYGLKGGNLTTKLGMVLPVSSYPTISGGVLNTDILLGDFVGVFVGSDFTLANPTNAVDGQKVTWKFTTNGPTRWTITYGNKFRDKSGVFPAMSFTPGAASWWYLTARYNAAQTTWDIVDYSY